MADGAQVTPVNGEGATILDFAASRDALLRSPTPDLMFQTGDAFFAARRGDEAIRLILEVTARRADDWLLALSGVTVILRYTIRYDIADRLLDIALQCRPDVVLAQGLRAHVRMLKGDVAGGCALFSAMLQRYPDQRAAICEQMSMSFLEIGYPMESLKILRSHLESGPATAAILANVGCSLERLNRSAEALPWFEKAIHLDSTQSETRFAYVYTLLKAGRLREGWPLYFDRALSVLDRTAWYLSLPRLRPGDDVAGRRIILFYEQALGDTIQFIRFVPDLVAKGARVTILVPRPLVRLLAQSYPEARVCEVDGFGREDGYDYAVPIPDLPYIGGAMSLREISAPIPYLRADPDDVGRFAALLPAGRPRVGLVWAGERRAQCEQMQMDQRRSTTLAALGTALTPVDATLVSLQFGGPRGEIAQWTGQTLCDPMGAVHDMADTAAIMANLDLIISVDTSPVHLAGALGCRVWMISRQDACWRWGDSGDRSPWYPGMRLFRARERSLAPVLQEVGTALRTWVDTWRPS